MVRAQVKTKKSGRKVDIDSIAKNISSLLGDISIKEICTVWVVEIDEFMAPEDMVDLQFEKILTKYIKKIIANIKLSKLRTAADYCKGILKGIYLFQKSCEFDYWNYGVSAPEDFFKLVLDKWKKNCKDVQYLTEIEGYVLKELPNWNKYQQRSRQTEITEEMRQEMMRISKEYAEKLF